MHRTAVLAALACLAACSKDSTAPPIPASPATRVFPPAPVPKARDFRLVHVFVALCDNAHQGIVPVPARLGDGRDPANNLYWGAAYGVKTFFARSPNWEKSAVGSPAAPDVLDRVAFRSRSGPTVVVVADAYDGARMDSALMHFMDAAGGLALENDGQVPDLVAFVGHNGLMDLTLPLRPKNTSRVTPAGSVVLACKSRAYFAEPLRLANCPALVTTTGFMAPEAYVLDAILRSWAGGDGLELIRIRAAQAYAAYQKCSESAARRLFAE